MLCSWNFKFSDVPDEEVIEVHPDESDSDDSDLFYDALDDLGQLRAERKRAVPLRDKLLAIQSLVLTKKQRNFKKNIEGYYQSS